jgi:hypothetical protein
MRRRGTIYPLTRLAIAMGSAARNIHDARRRKIAESDAARIPKCAVETGVGKKGEIARRGRALLARLSTLQPDELAGAADELRACAGAISSRFEVTSEVTYRGRRSKSLTG